MIKTQHTHTWNSQGINKNYTYKKVESHWGRHQCQPLPFTAACTCSSASKLKSKSRDGSFLGATTVCWVVGNRAALAVSLFSLTPQRWECWCPDGRQGARRVVPYMRFQSLLFASTSLSVLTQVFSTCPPNLLFVLSLSAHRLHEGCACVLTPLPSEGTNVSITSTERWKRESQRWWRSRQVGRGMAKV